jgi:vacuolar-type H+-ATPase subunit D/Vma8
MDRKLPKISTQSYHLMQMQIKMYPAHSNRSSTPKTYKIVKNLNLTLKIFSLRESMPPSWIDFSQENISTSNHEREASIRLRGMISSTLSQTSADMRDQADRVEEAMSRRIAETEEATRSLEDELKAVNQSVV